MSGPPLLRGCAIVRGHPGAASRAVASLLLAMGLAGPAGAQPDSLVPALQLSVAAGPALDVGSGTSARIGYTLQGAVAIVRPRSPWRLRADVVYQHAGRLDGDMHASRDFTSGMSGDAVSSAAGFANAVFAPRATRGVVPYAVGGIGLGWVDAMRGTAYTEGNRSTVGFAWQGGGGFEWGRGGRPIRLETRLQSIRSPGVARWYTTIPVTVGVRF